MAVARFYHLTRDPVEALLPRLIGMAREHGLTVAVRGTEAARMAALDRLLWQGDGFLAHGLAGGPHDAAQPVLLVADATPAPDLANRPACLITVDGAPVTAPEASALDRLCIVFDGTSDAAVNAARDQWRALTAQDIQAEYWSQASGRWACKARHPKTG